MEYSEEPVLEEVMGTDVNSSSIEIPENVEPMGIEDNHVVQSYGPYLKDQISAGCCDAPSETENHHKDVISSNACFENRVNVGEHSENFGCSDSPKYNSQNKEFKAHKGFEACEDGIESSGDSYHKEVLKKDVERDCDENISLSMKHSLRENEIKTEDSVTSHHSNVTFPLHNEHAPSVLSPIDTQTCEREIAEEESVTYNSANLIKAEDAIDTVVANIAGKAENKNTSMISLQPITDQKNVEDEISNCVAAANQSSKLWDALPLKENSVTFPSLIPENCNVQISSSDTAGDGLILTGQIIGLKESATHSNKATDSQINIFGNSQFSSQENGHLSEFVIKTENSEQNASPPNKSTQSESSWTKTSKDISQENIELITVEPADFDSKEENHSYRNAVYLVNYSDSETSSSSESYDSAPELVGEENDNDADSEIEEQNNKSRKSKASSNQSHLMTRLRSNGEVFPEELPPLDYLTISAPAEIELVQLGTVSGIVDVLVVIKALEATPALYDDSVLFLENRLPLGLIFETLGTVERPFYSVRFNSAQDIKEKGVKIGEKIMYAPKADNLTKYIFISELRKMRADDASWEFDNEPPEGVKDFSDDEEERRAKGKSKSSSRQKRKRPGTQNPIGADHNPSLLRGDLNKNPFGNRNQKFGNISTLNRSQQQKPKTEKRPTCGESSLPISPRVPPAGFQSDGINAQCIASFGHKPAWMNRPGLMGAAVPQRPFFANSASLPNFCPSPNVQPQQFSRSPMNPSVQSQRFCPPPNFNRPPPSMRPVHGPANQMRPFHSNNMVRHPPFPPPPFPFSGNANAFSRQ